MAYPHGQLPWRAVVGRKRAAADRHLATAERLRREADELEAKHVAMATSAQAAT